MLRRRTNNRSSDQKKNKRSFIIGALILLLCLMFLLGVTVALFINDLDDGTIGIITTTGKIKVDIVDARDEQSSLEGRALQFEKGALFEPGATFCTQGFKVKNTGNIAIRFRMAVSEDEKIDMTEFHEAFDVWITTDSSGKGEICRLTDFDERLEAGESSERTYYLLVHMKTSAENEFQGRTYSGIGITVYAVQGNVTIEE